MNIVEALKLARQGKRVYSEMTFKAFNGDNYKIDYLYYEECRKGFTTHRSNGKEHYPPEIDLNNILYDDWEVVR